MRLIDHLRCLFAGHDWLVHCVGDKCVLFCPTCRRRTMLHVADPKKHGLTRGTVYVRPAP